MSTDNPSFFRWGENNAFLPNKRALFSAYAGRIRE